MRLNRYYNTCIIIVFFCVQGYSQLDSLYALQEKKYSTGKDSISAFQKNYFQQLGMGVISDWGSGKFMGRYTYISDGNGKFTDSVPVTNAYLCLLFVTYEGRYNLYNHKDFFSVSAGMATTAQFAIYTNRDGLFGLRFTPTIDCNFYNHSTYNNTDRTGFHFGAGLALTLAPLVFIDGTPSEPNRFWMSPVVRAGAKFPFKGKNSFLNITYGFPTKKVVRGNLKGVQGQIFCLTLGRLINYD